MIRSLGAMARAIATLTAALIVVGAVVVLCKTPALAAVTCDRNATPSSFASELSAATGGQTICLASGNYGTFSGTNKAVTITKAAGATPTMKISFSTGDSGFTIDGFAGMGGQITGGANNITIRNSAFDSEIGVDGTATGSNILFDGNSHNNISGSTTANRFLARGGGLTIRNSLFQGGGADGVRLATSAPVNVIGNTFLNIISDASGNHTDMIQWYGGSNAVVRGNLFKQTVAGELQVMGAYDGTGGNLIEDNVVDVSSRPWAVELYSDDGSVVRHNTFVYRSGCAYNYNCGIIALDRKAADDAGRNTQVYDNIATSFDIGNGSTALRRDHNMVHSGAATGDFVGAPTFQGGAAPATYAGYGLTASSVGAGRASDGLDVGIRASGSTTPTPTPTPTPSPTPTPTPTPPPTTDIAADALWTPPSGAKVGTAVTLDGTGSKGNAPISCTWVFENQDGTAVFETLTGCKLQKTFQNADTKYLKLTVRDSDGDTDTNRQSFAVAPAGTTSADKPADAVWTPPSGARVGVAVTLDGTRSTGDGPVSCTWTFEDKAGTTVYETLTGCKLQKTFKYAGPKYLKLTVRDNDGDTDTNRQSFAVKA